MKLAIAVAEWLLGRETVIAATPVVVQVGRRIYPAVRYSEGRNEERLYLIGEMPPLHDKMWRLCYRTDDSDYDWHLLAYFKQRTDCTEWREVHPFGSHFILAQWSPVENWAADQIERRPYHRTPMTITEIGPAKVEEKQDEPNAN
jgi:hypothetical protein